MKRIHVFLFVVLMLIVAMALCTVIFAACNSPLPEDIEGIEIGVCVVGDALGDGLTTSAPAGVLSL